MEVLRLPGWKLALNGIWLLLLPDQIIGQAQQLYCALHIFLRIQVNGDAEFGKHVVGSCPSSRDDLINLLLREGNVNEAIAVNMPDLSFLDKPGRATRTARMWS